MSDTKSASAITGNTVITGAEFRDFCENHWPHESWYLDDTAFTYTDDDGKWVLPPDAKVTLYDCGFFGWQGDDNDARAGKIVQFDEFYRAYAEQRTSILVTVEVPLDRIERLKSVMAEMGVTVLVESGNAVGADATAETTSLGPR